MSAAIRLNVFLSVVIFVGFLAFQKQSQHCEMLKKEWNKEMTAKISLMRDRY